MLDIRDNERIDATGFGPILIIQDPEEFCYGVDAVILARAAAGSETVEISPLGRLYAELDGEEGLGQGDLTLLLRKLAGW